jgi:hypothetical protein
VLPPLTHLTRSASPAAAVTTARPDLE